jgi:hypothetical protein
VVVFSEPLASKPLALVVQVLAFALILVAGAMTPSPMVQRSRLPSVDAA